MNAAGVVADRRVRARTQLVELGDVVGRLRAARGDGAVELRHGFLGAAERQVQPAAQRRQRAVVVVVHAAGLAQRQLGAVAPLAGFLERIALDQHAAHAHLRQAGADAIADALVNLQRFFGGHQRLVESAGGLEDRCAPVERRGEADLRVLFAEECDGLVDQRQRLRVIAHRELRHRQAAGGNHGFFTARVPAQQGVGAQQVVERLVGIAITEIQPAAIAQQAAERQRSITDSIDEAREFDGGGVDAAELVLTSARTVRMRIARSDMSRPAAAPGPRRRR